MIYFNQIVISDVSIKGNDNLFKLVFGKEDINIIMYKIWMTQTYFNHHDEFYKMHLDMWVKLFKNYNFKSKIRFTPSTQIIIGNTIFETKLVDSDLDFKRRPVLIFTMPKTSDIDIKSLYKNKYKDVKITVDFNPEHNPDLIKFFTPTIPIMPKAHKLYEDIPFQPHINEIIYNINNSNKNAYKPQFQYEKNNSYNGVCIVAKDFVNNDEMYYNGKVSK